MYLDDKSNLFVKAKKTPASKKCLPEHWLKTTKNKDKNYYLRKDYCCKSNFFTKILSP